ncbi:MAG TPA: M56 family metallopeptidase [Micromonosporaceae bacterium]
MDVSVYIPLYLGVILTAVTPPIIRLLPPRTGVWCLTAAAVTAAASWVVSLAMIAFTGLGRITFVAQEGHWSATLWRGMDPVSIWTARAAGVVLIVCLLVFVRALVREMMAWIQINRLVGRLATPERLIFVDDDAPHAYAVGGRRPRIVVSSGLLRGLSTAERRTVLAHESSHVRHRHDRHLMVLRLAAAISPLLRMFVPAGELAVERWADEETAATIGDRTLVARTVLRAALAGAGTALRPHGSLAHASGDVGRRIKALMQAPPRPRWSVTAVAWLLLLATISAPFYAADNLNVLFNRATQPHTEQVGVIKAGVNHHLVVRLTPPR